MSGGNEQGVQHPVAVAAHHHHHAHGPHAHHHHGGATSTGGHNHGGHHAAPVFWPKEATLLLIELYKQNEARFGSGLVRKKLIWKEIAEHVQRAGHAFSWEQCEGRWKTLTSAYRRAQVHGRCSQFHKELHDVLGYGADGSSSAAVANALQQQQQPRPIAPKQQQAQQQQQGQQQQQQQPGHSATTPTVSSASTLVLNGAPSSASLELDPSGSTGSGQNGPPGSAGPPQRMMLPAAVAAAANKMVVRCKKRRTPNSDILDWMAEFEDRQERRSREFLEKMERMHCEKISVITELISVMKDLVK